MDSTFLSILTTLPFIGWYAWRLHMLTLLKTEGAPATATIIQILGGMAQYQYEAGSKNYKKQIRLDKVYGSKVKKGDTLPIVYAPSRPNFSCPAGSIQNSARISRRLLIGAVILSVLLSLPLILTPALT